jgi:hypothetical protein
MVTQQGITSDNIINVSGGTDKIKAYGSFGYLNNKGTIKGNLMKDIQQKQMLTSPLQNGFLLEAISVLPIVNRNMVNHRLILQL